MVARVLIAGGGVAGLEAAIALHELVGERTEVEICSPREDFVYRPFAVGAPYGRSLPLRYGLPRLAERCGAEFRLASIASVDAPGRTAGTHDGEEIAFDYLIAALGARALSGVPGAVPFWGVVDESGMQGVVRELRDGALRRVIFTMPDHSGWSLPLYELALLAGAEVAKARVSGTKVTVVTPEEAPLQVFGRRASEEVSELLAQHGVEFVGGTHPVEFEDGILAVAPGEGMEADAVVSLPRLEGRRIEGLPHDECGFLVTDGCGWVQGTERVLAAGDVTTFPVKQGGIATQQADTAVEAIAAELGAGEPPQPLDPILRGVLWTGGEPRYLYGRPAGGHGEVSELSEEAEWATQPEDKIIGRFLNPFLAELNQTASC